MNFKGNWLIVNNSKTSFQCLNLGPRNTRGEIPTVLEKHLGGFHGPRGESNGKFGVFPGEQLEICVT